LPFSWILTPTFIDRIAAKYDKLQCQISLKHNSNDIIVQYSSLNSDNLISLTEVTLTIVVAARPRCHVHYPTGYNSGASAHSGGVEMRRALASPSVRLWHLTLSLLLQASNNLREIFENEMQVSRSAKACSLP
jgi:hypothetical protein